MDQTATEQPVVPVRRSKWVERVFVTTPRVILSLIVMVIVVAGIVAGG